MLLGAIAGLGCFIGSIFAHAAQTQSIRLAEALAWCYIFSPTGMAHLRELGYSNAVVTLAGTSLGALAAWTWSKLAYRGFDRFIHSINKKRAPLLTTPATISEEDHSHPPYILITLTACCDAWAALGIALSHSKTKEKVVTVILVLVSITRNLSFGAFLAWITAVSPFAAHHLELLGFALFGAYFATTRLVKWARRTIFIAQPQPNDPVH